MTITQHLHIYNFHTSNFNFGETILKCLSIQPLVLGDDLPDEGTLSTQFFSGLVEVFWVDISACKDGVGSVQHHVVA